MFKLTEAGLKQAFRRARLSPDPAGAYLFGIRGCLPADADGMELAGAHALALATPDNLYPRCTLGYWRPDAGFAVFPGSTVPARRYVEKARAASGAGANQLCLGLHRGYRRGIHNSASVRFGHRALRMDKALPIMRSADDLDFDADDRLELETAYDNIHCGWVAGPDASGFSSAGCQVVVGSANPEVGPWRAFAALIYGGGQIEYDYALFSGGEIQRTAMAADADALPLALRYGSGGDEVEAVQAALNARGYPTAGVDGDFGWRTLVAVFRFQKEVMGQKSPDGIVGEQTLAALGVSGAEAAPKKGAELAALSSVHKDPGEVEAPAAAPAPTFEFDVELSDAGKWRHHYATRNGQKYYLGYETKPRPSIVFLGLVQNPKRLEPLGAQRYDPTDYAEFGYWADFLVPTSSAESARWHERINTYDRAALTFGFFQAAAHTPDDNFILLFKDMLRLPSGGERFPELELLGPKGQERLHLRRPGGSVDLEVAEPRSAGSKELNLKRFMAYLNPTLQAIEPSELDVAARLMEWTRDEAACRRLQVDHAVRAIRTRMGYVRKALVGRPVDQCLLAADILYQWRAGPALVTQALNAAAPYSALKALGAADYGERIATVDAQLKSIMTKPEIKALRFDPKADTLFS